MTPDPLDPRPDAEELFRFLAGDDPPASRSVTDMQLQRDPVLATLAQELARATSLPVVEGAHVDADWQRVRYKGRNVVEGSIAARPNHGFRRWISRPVMATLALAGALLFAIFVSRDPASHAAGRAAQSYSTAPGEHATLVLVSGSRITMGPATTLTVTLSDKGIPAAIYLNGQALFQVSHDTRSPFTVYTSRAVTQVLGTTFMVRQYATDSTVRIMVAEGKVSIQRAQGRAPVGVQTVLTQDMMGTIADSGQINVTRNIAAEPYTAWITGELVFQKTAASDVVADLARAYGVQMKIADTSLARRPITWGVHTNRTPLPQVLRELTLLLGAHMRWTGDTLTILPGRRTAEPSVSRRQPFTQESQYGK